MTDPYNSFPPQMQAVATARTESPAPQRDTLARLDVSDTWKARFRLIEKAGGPTLPKFRDLPASDRRGIQFNWIAFFLGPFYYLAKGLWRQAIVYLLLAIACVLVMEAIGLGQYGRAVGYGFAAVYAVRANTSYYRLRVLGEAPWL